MNKLPSGELTDDSSRYCEEWRSIADKLESALECKVIAFDPGFLLCQNESTCSMPMWVARKIVGLAQCALDKG